jgi:NADPH2:quinone reductase
LANKEAAMRAAFYEANGAARDVLKVGQVETVTPAQGQVRVRLRTSGVNPSDVKTRAGRIMKMAYPRVIPHSDGAGEIDAVGAGVAQSRVGERVWIWNAQWQRPFGSAAEYVVLPAEQAVPLPTHIGFDAGACLGIPALTAYHAVTMDGPVQGQTLLVSGGAGAVSHYAIQMAKTLGAKVVTTVSSAEKAELVKAAGADCAINYKTEDVAACVKEFTQGRGVNRVLELDIAVNAKLLPGVLAHRGKVVAYGTSGLEAPIPAIFSLLNSIAIEFFLVYTLDAGQRAAAVAGINQMLEKNQLIHNIAARLPLDQVIDAHEAVESGKMVGNVVLLID